jgi:hypothetical protein
MRGARALLAVLPLMKGCPPLHFGHGVGDDGVLLRSGVSRLTTMTIGFSSQMICRVMVRAVKFVETLSCETYKSPPYRQLPVVTANLSSSGRGVGVMPCHALGNRPGLEHPQRHGRWALLDRVKC